MILSNNETFYLVIYQITIFADLQDKIISRERWFDFLESTAKIEDALTDQDDRIPTNLRTLRILEVLGASDTPMTPTQINNELGLPKQTVHRLCKTLVAEGYLAKAPNDKRLRPTRRLRGLASGILFSSRTYISRHQVLMDVASRVNETVNFVVPEEEGMIYQDRVETDWPFRIQLPIGTHVPFHCTASGKTFLASLSPTARRSFVRSLSMKKFTPNTFDDPGALLDELKKISKDGYAVDNEEFVEGMVAIAVPIVDSNGRYCAALAFHGPLQRLSIEGAKTKLDILTNAASVLSTEILS